MSRLSWSTHNSFYLFFFFVFIIPMARRYQKLTIRNFLRKINSFKNFPIDINMVTYRAIMASFDTQKIKRIRDIAECTEGSWTRCVPFSAAFFTNVSPRNKFLKTRERGGGRLCFYLDCLCVLTYGIKEQT